MINSLYNTLLTLALILSSPLFAFKIITTARYRRGLGQRLGISYKGVCKKVTNEKPLWIHAASVGEMVAAGSLVRALRSGGVGPVALTAVTRTGRSRGESLQPDIGPYHLPLDARGPVGTFLDRLRPRALVLLETEIWPNLLLELERRGVRWGVASGRVSRRTLRRAALARGLFARVLAGASAVGARTEADAEGFRRLGASPEVIRVTGDLKDDREVPEWAPPPPGGPRWRRWAAPPG